MSGRALDAVRALLGDEPRRHVLLIEHLRRLRDHFWPPLDGAPSRRSLAKWAGADRGQSGRELHHRFDIVRDGRGAAGTLTVRVCDGLPCEMAGARDLLERLPGMLGGIAGRRGPVRRALRAGTGGGDRAAQHGLRGPTAAGRWRPALREPMLRPISGWPTPSRSAAWAGAGFPAGRKWRIVRAEPAPRLMAVNIDEGEPGTFKDRFYLERDPHRFLEGMLVAAWAVGIMPIYIYLRDEYHALPRDPAGANWPGCAPTRPARRCRRSSCAAAPAPTSAAKSRR